MSYSHLKTPKRNCNSPLKNCYSANDLKHQTVSSEVVSSKSISNLLIRLWEFINFIFCNG